MLTVDQTQRAMISMATLVGSSTVLTRNDILHLSACQFLVRSASQMEIGLTLKLTCPCLYSSTRRLYTGKGLEPVGKPRTKWVFSFDGLKADTLRAM